MKNLLERFHLDVIEVSDESVNGPMGGILQRPNYVVKVLFFLEY